MEMILFIVICFIILIAVGAGYNKAVILRNYVREAFSTMDVYLKKRWDLIPNLIECVKGYSIHEKEVFSNITELRAKNYDGFSKNEKLSVNGKLSQMLPNIMAVAENYPELKANENFLQLMSELSQLEEDIANSRKYYNGTVREFNTFIETFPSNLIASAFGFKTEKMFETGSGERANVKVKF